MSDNKLEIEEVPTAESSGKSESGLGDMSPVKVEGFDWSEYEGKPSKIEFAKVEDVKSNYAVESMEVKGVKFKVGDLLPTGVTVPSKVLKVTSEKLGEYEFNGEKREIRATELIGLKKRNDDSWGWSLSEKAKLQKLYKRLKLAPETNPQELVGKKVTIISRPSADGENSWLGILI